MAAVASWVNITLFEPECREERRQRKINIRDKMVCSDNTLVSSIISLFRGLETVFGEVADHISF